MDRPSTQLNISGNAIFFAPIASVILFILSFPHWISGYLSFIAFVPFFLSILFAKNYRESIFAGSLFGLALSVYFTLPLYHSLRINNNSTLTAFLMIIFSVSLPYCIIYGSFAAFYKYCQKKGSYLLPSLLWVFIDYVKEIFPIFIPWGFAGYAQVFTPFIQLADITGIHGVTLIIIIVNTSFTEMICKKDFNAKHMVALILLIASLGYGIYKHDELNKLEDSSQKIE